MLFIDHSPIRFRYSHPLIFDDGSLISFSDTTPIFKINFCAVPDFILELPVRNSGPTSTSIGKFEKLATGLFGFEVIHPVEILFSRGEMLATVRAKDGLSEIPAILPVRIYINPEKKTFTIAEYHTDYNSICVLAFGENYTTLGIES